MPPIKLLCFLEFFILDDVVAVEMEDSDCKCFTGRITRLVNCLNGFTDLVKINISDNQQIGNIIVIIKEKLQLDNNYSVEKHKELVIKELTNRGYSIFSWETFGLKFS